MLKIFRHNNKFAINNIDIYLAICGVGKANASFALATILNNWKIDLCINVGTAAGISKDIEILDVIIGTQYKYADVDVTTLKFELGQIPFMPKKYETNKFLLEKITGNFIKKGLVLTQDKFVHHEDDLNHLTNNFKNPLCVEMEATALAQCCYLWNIPFVMIKGISDSLILKNNTNDFKQNIYKASIRSNEACLEFIKQLA